MPHLYLAACNPRDQGNLEIYPVYVNEMLPTLKIPLLPEYGDVVLDFDAAYQTTFHDHKYGRQIDYEHLPIHLDKFSAADQQKITARMQEIQAEYSRGKSK